MGPDANGEEMWKCPAVQLTKVEKRMILAEVVAIGVRTMFKTHLYTFGGRVFHQRVGGPIGLSGTGAIVRVVMGMTDRRVKSKMAASKVKTKIDARYVDDGRTLLMPVKRGWRWTEDGVRWSKEWNDEDEEIGEYEHQKWSKAWSIVPMPVFAAQWRQERTLRMADCQLWTQTCG